MRYRLTLIVFYFLVTPAILLCQSEYWQGQQFAPNWGAVDWQLRSNRIQNIQDLNGKVVLLYFPNLKDSSFLRFRETYSSLLKRFPDSIAIINGLDFSESVTQNISLLNKINWQYPTFVSSENVKTLYQITTSNQLAVISPTGKLIQTGLDPFSDLDTIRDIVDENVNYYDAINQINRMPIVVNRSKERTLFSPTQPVVKGPRGERLFFISGNKVIVTRPNGEILMVIGHDTAGDQDGTVQDTRFNCPQGLFVTEKGIWIADTFNYKLKFLDFAKNRVKTLSFDFGKQVIPFDVLELKNQLFISDAAYSDIIQVDLRSGDVLQQKTIKDIPPVVEWKFQTNSTRVPALFL